MFPHIGQKSSSTFLFPVRYVVIWAFSHMHQIHLSKVALEVECYVFVGLPLFPLVFS